MKNLKKKLKSYMDTVVEFYATYFDYIYHA